MSRKKKQTAITEHEALTPTIETPDQPDVTAEALSEELSEEPEVESSEEDTVPFTPEDTEAADTDKEPAAKENELEADMQTIDALKAEIERLKEQIEKLEELKRAQNRILAEIGDFVALFPEIPIEEIPDTVWESVKQGAPLAASYALYEKRMVAEAKRIAEINAKNAKKSPGAAGKDTAGEYFSPEDVRRMSRAEVHANYSKIKDSMKKWM